MKLKVIISVVLMVAMLMLSSCEAVAKGAAAVMQGMSSVYFSIVGTEGENATKMLEDLLKAAEEKDAAAISAMFSETAKEKVDSFETSVNELIEYYEGSLVSSEMPHGGPGSEYSRDGSVEKKTAGTAFNVKTSKCDYRVCIDWVEIDTENESNVGIYSFYIIKTEDDINLDYAYIGDGKQTYGINIGVQNAGSERFTYIE